MRSHYFTSSSEKGLIVNIIILLHTKEVSTNIYAIVCFMFLFFC